MLSPMVLARIIQALAIEPGATGARCGLRPRLFVGDPCRSRAPRSLRSRSSESLAASARQCLAGSGAQSVKIACGPLEQGFATDGPYDAVLINGAVEISVRTRCCSSFRKAAAWSASSAAAAPPRRRSTSARARALAPERSSTPLHRCCPPSAPRPDSSSERPDTVSPFCASREYNAALPPSSDCRTRFRSVLSRLERSVSGRDWSATGNPVRTGGGCGKRAFFQPKRRVTWRGSLHGRPRGDEWRAGGNSR